MDASAIHHGAAYHKLGLRDRIVMLGLRASFSIAGLSKTQAFGWGGRLAGCGDCGPLASAPTAAINAKIIRSRPQTTTSSNEIWRRAPSDQDERSAMGRERQFGARRQAMRSPGGEAK
jgi:hypothetical protein